MGQRYWRFVIVLSALDEMKHKYESESGVKEDLRKIQSEA